MTLDYLSPEHVEAAFRRFFAAPPPEGLARLTALTPGDFAVVRRKADALGQLDEPECLAEMLRTEHDAKPGQPQSLNPSSQALRLATLVLLLRELGLWVEAQPEHPQRQARPRHRQRRVQMQAQARRAGLVLADQPQAPRSRDGARSLGPCRPGSARTVCCPRVRPMVRSRCAPVIPGNPSTEQSGQINGGSHELNRETTEVFR